MPKPGLYGFKFKNRLKFKLDSKTRVLVQVNLVRAWVGSLVGRALVFTTYASKGLGFRVEGSGFQGLGYRA